MSDERSFLAAIRASPTDDLPRLVFADWLQEQGQVERGEFIRLQCELGVWERSGYVILPDTHTSRSTVSDGKGHVITADRFHKLKDRERHLIENHELDLLAGAPLLDVGCQANSTWVPEAEWEFRRGFIHTVTMPLRWWAGGPCGNCRGSGDVPPEWAAGHGGRQNIPCRDCKGTGKVAGIGRQVMASHPVARVVLTNLAPREVVDAEPARGSRLSGVDDVGELGEWYFRSWYQAGPWGRDEHRDHNTPPELFDLMLTAEGAKQYPRELHLVFFPSRDLALDALSDACIAWALT